MRKADRLPDLENFADEAYDGAVQTSALAILEDGTLESRQYQFSHTGLIIYEALSKEDWKRLGKTLRQLDGAVQWLIGDWMVYGELGYGLNTEQIAEIIERDVHTLENYAWVARSIPHSLRRESLSFGHHMLVAGLDSDAKKAEWLASAAEGNWSIRQLRREMNGIKPPALPANGAVMSPRAARKKITEFAKLLPRIGQGDQDAKETAKSQLSQIREWTLAMERWINTVQTKRR